MNRRTLFMFLNEIRPLIKCPDVVACKSVHTETKRLPSGIAAEATN